MSLETSSSTHALTHKPISHIYLIPIPYAFAIKVANSHVLFIFKVSSQSTSCQLHYTTANEATKLLEQNWLSMK